MMRLGGPRMSSIGSLRKTYRITINNSSNSNSNSNSSNFIRNHNKNFFQCRVASSSSSSSSSWAVADFPWSPPARQEKTKRMTQEMIELQWKKEEFEKLVRQHVRRYLPKKFPASFAVRSSKKFLVSYIDQNNAGTIMETLASLNGYERVPLPEPFDLVDLAEGIVVQPDFYDKNNGYVPSKNIFLFAQPIDAYAYPDTVINKEYPELIEEDIRIYSMMENLTEEIITSVYDNIRLTLLKNIVNPLEAVIARLIGVKSRAEEIEKVEEKKKDGKSSNNNQLYNLIVLQGREAVLITHMYPSVYLLALPYTLGHKTASTIISVSLVVFGAIPLAYRSLQFALNYPLLSELIAASVIGTIVYGIWSGRSISRTRQSEVVLKGMSSRIYARDDAVLWALQEGAVQRVSKAVLAIYYDELEDLLDRASVKQPKPYMSSLVDPMEITTEMGLLVPKKQQEQQGEKVTTLGNNDKHVPLHIDEAIAVLRSKH